MEAILNIGAPSDYIKPAEPQKTEQRRVETTPYTSVGRSEEK